MGNGMAPPPLLGYHDARYPMANDWGGRDRGDYSDYRRDYDRRQPPPHPNS